MDNSVTASRTLGNVLGNVERAMTANVLVLPPQMRASEAVVIMGRRGVAGAPVVEGGVVVGVVTLADLWERTGHVRAQTSGPFLRPERHLSTFDVRDVMTRDVVTVTTDTLLIDAAVMMEARGVNRLPVVDATGRPVGILARDDVIRAVARATKGDPAERDNLARDDVKRHINDASRRTV